MADAAVFVRFEIGADRSHLALPAWRAMAGPATSGQGRKPAEPGARSARALSWWRGSGPLVISRPISPSVQRSCNRDHRLPSAAVRFMETVTAPS